MGGHTMGTSWHVKLMRPPHMALSELQTGVQHTLDQVVAQMSHWDANSDLSRFNSAPAGSWHGLPPELFTVLDYALFIAQQSGGAFDPSIGKIVNIWGFGPDHRASTVPDATVLQQARQSCGWQQLSVERLPQRAYQPGGVQLDLSGIAKGFGIDQVARYLEAQGINSYLVEVGGELRGLGCKPDNSPWWVQLEQPVSASNRVTAIRTIVALHGLSIATSGDYRRYFEQEGQRYSHTIDPRTGYPIEHALASVTVLHAECMAADALATAILVLGPEAGLAYAEQWRLPCLFISRSPQGLSETMSSPMRAMLEKE